jgi:CBS domain-containing membrane protein
MTALTVRDLMTSRVFSVGPNDSLSVVWDIMEEHHIRHVPVVDDEGRVVGLVSNRDLVRTALHDDVELPLTERQDLLGALKVRAAMVRGVETVTPETSIDEAGEMMLENKFSCLPVTEVQGRGLVGIITEADFVRYVVNL